MLEIYRVAVELIYSSKYVKIKFNMLYNNSNIIYKLYTTLYMQREI